jgi:hypothetical protein
MLTGKSGFPDKAPYRLRREIRSDDSGNETTGLSRLPISLLGLKTGTLFSGTSTLTPLFGFRPTRPALCFTENAPKPRIDAILPGHRSNDFIEYNVYGFFHHTLGEMKELTCYVERQLRFDHYKGASVVVERRSVRSFSLRSFFRKRVQFAELPG